MTYIKVDSSFVRGELKTSATEKKSSCFKELSSIVDSNAGPYADFNGWFDYPSQNGYKELEKVAEYVSELTVYYDSVLVVGVGGSYLGTKAVYNYFCGNEYPSVFDVQTSNKIKPLLFFGYHLSEYETAKLLRKLDDQRPLVVVISKSGGTLEPTLAYRIVENYMSARFGLEEADARTIYVTDPEKGKLLEKAGHRKIKTFPIPKNIGGRYSVLSPCGLVPLYLSGLNVSSLLDGANKFYEEIKLAMEKNYFHPCLHYASLRASAFESGKRIENLFFAEPRFKSIVEWWKQLFAESEGKNKKGMYPTGFFITADLHSLSQMLQDGDDIFFSTFLEYDSHQFKESSLKHIITMPKSLGFQNDDLGYLEGLNLNNIVDKAMQATRLAHFEGGLSSFVLRLPDDSLFSLGYLLSFFKVSCAISCRLLGVHPFDQPGVESYKRNLLALLGKPGTEEERIDIDEKLRKISC